MRIAMMQKKMGWSGQSVQVMELALGLRGMGHEILLLAQPGSVFSERARAAGFVVSEFKMKGWAQIPAFFSLARILRKNRVELLHCHDAREHQIGCLAARLAATPAVVRTKHNVLPLRNALSRMVCGPLTSHIISVSDAVKAVLVECGVSPDHVTTVHNFVDSIRFRPRPPDPKLRSSLGLEEGAFTVGTVGRLHHSKGIKELLDSVPMVLESFPSARFLLVGGHDEQWRDRVEALGIGPFVRFTGAVTDVPNYLALMDVVVFPTHREAFGLAVLEAMASKKAVVASRVDALREVVREGEEGLLVKPRDPGALAEAVLRVARERPLRDRLAGAAFRRATETFTRERCVGATLEVYRKALDR